MRGDSKTDQVVVTGIGAVTSIGLNAGSFWSSLLESRSGFHTVCSFDLKGQRTSVGCEVRDFNEAIIRKEGLNIGGRATAMAVTATGEALQQAGLEGKLDRYSVGVCIGTTMGEIGILEQYSQAVAAGAATANHHQRLAQYPCSVIPRGVAEFYRLKGPNIMVPTACAAGNYAIGIGRDLILEQQAEVALVGGVDPYSRVAHTGFNRLLAVAPDVCRPFDAERKGIIPGEGAGILVLEAQSRAEARGAAVLAVVHGCGISNDALHITNPDPQGKGLAKAMKRAIADASIDPGQIDYISAHGTGTTANDIAETRAIKRFLGARAFEVPVSSIKSMVGHTMGAASALEAVASVMALKTGKIPPTMNYEHSDPQCDLDYVPNHCRTVKLETILSNSLAFGGNNSCLVLGRGQS